MKQARIQPTEALTGLLDLAVKHVKKGEIPRYVLDGLLDEIGIVLGKVRPKEVAAELTTWTPRPDQIWRSSMRTPEGKRLTAWAFYQERFKNDPDRPYAHLLRQHPDTKEFYDALCVFMSRNKSKGLTPNSIEQLFPSSPLALGGKLVDRKTRAKS